MYLVQRKRSRRKEKYINKSFLFFYYQMLIFNILLVVGVKLTFSFILLSKPFKPLYGNQT